MSLDTEKLAQNVAKNDTFTAISRILMVIASVAGLPIAGAILWRIVNTADDIVEKVSAQAVKIELLDQGVKFGFDAAKGNIDSLRTQLVDHEGRIRSVESDLRKVTPR